MQTMIRCELIGPSREQVEGWARERVLSAKVQADNSRKELVVDESYVQLQFEYCEDWARTESYYRASYGALHDKFVRGAMQVVG